MSQPSTIVILGFGSLMESLLPCCYSLLKTSDPQQLAKSIYAVKGSTQGLSQKQSQYPFPITAANNLQVLEEVHPDVILFSPPPSKARELCETVLLPYYQALRQQNQPLPLLITFPPTPLPRYYRQILGKDAIQATLLPCVVQRAGSYTVGHLGYSLLGLDGRNLPDQQRMQWLQNFTRPVGNLLFPAQDDLIACLAGMVTAHNVYELCFTLEEAFSYTQEPLSLPEIAAAMRRELRRFAPELIPADDPQAPECTGTLSPLYEEIVGHTLRGWYEGLCLFAAEKKLDLQDYGSFLRSTLDVLLMTVQTETQETLQHLSAGCATKGGLLEQALLSFAQKVAHPLSHWVLEDIAETSQDCIAERQENESWAVQLVSLAQQVAEDVFARGNHLE